MKNLAQFQLPFQFQIRIRSPFSPQLSAGLQLILIVLLFIAPNVSYAEILRAVEAKAEPLTVDLPLFDLPFNAYNGGVTVPSFDQSLQLSTDFLQTGHLVIGRLLGDQNSIGTQFANLGFDAVTIFLPLGTAWVHEEWHRATMTRRRVSSYNDVYNIPIGASVIAVSHVTDEDLIRFKRDHPAEFVRMSAAGIEAEAEQNLELEKRKFFLNSPTYDRNVLWINYMTNAFYLGSCAGGDVDEMTDKQNRQDGTSVEARDFTGFDCTGWAYDLNRPNEPYQARGPHPSGVGINRYRKYGDLAETEKDFLRLQAGLTWLNLLDPFLFRDEPFDGADPWNGGSLKWMLTMRHHLTPFGYSLAPNLFVREGETNMLFTVHAYVNARGALPGADLQLLRIPYQSEGQTVYLTLRGAAWFQPKEQLFQSDEGKFGGLAAVRISRPSGEKTETYVSLMGKSDGWVPGVLSLEADYQVLAGLTIQL